MDMKYMEEVESTGFNGLENVEAKGKGNIFSLGNQTEDEGDYGNSGEGGYGVWDGLATIQGHSEEYRLYSVNDGSH